MTTSDATALRKAAEQGDLAGLRAHLAAGAPVDAFPDGDDSPLCRAVQFGQLEAARVLLEAGANVRHAGQYRQTPLHAAVRVSLAMTELVLARGPDVNARNSSDQSALEEYLFHAPYKQLDPRIIDRLLEAGFDLSVRGTKYAARLRSPLALACGMGHLPPVERLLAAGLDVNEGSPPGEQVFTELCGLEPPAKQRALFARLVEAGLSPNASSRFRSLTALSLACRLGDEGLVRQLLERGADPNQQLEGTALMVAAGRGDVAIARLLLDRGADPNLRHRGTALTRAEDGQHLALVDLLLERGATPERQALEAPAAQALAVARAAAEQAPTSPTARLGWARALLAQGLRAAAFAEVQAAARLGAVVPAELRDAFTFESPPGTPWRFLEPAPAPEGLAPAVDDARFPGARVASGARVLPLVVALGPPCTACDEAGTVPCSSCNGTGHYTSYLDPDYEVACEPRDVCNHCGGALKFVVSTRALGKGACAHPSWALEAKTDAYTLERCAACGLAALQLPKWKGQALACGVCGRFACACP